MADTKLTDLTPLTGVRGCDRLYAVDKSTTTDATSGSSRQVSQQELAWGTVLSGNVLQLPGGRLTLESGNPASGSDQTGKTTLYYTPFLHDVVPLYHVGSNRFRNYVFREKSLALGTLTSGKNYDVLASYGGDPTYRASSSGTLSAASAVTLPTRVAGDLLVVFLTNTGTTSPAAGSGWTRQTQGTDGAGISAAIYTKVSDGTDATGPLAATATGTYACFSVENGTWADVIVGGVAAQTGVTQPSSQAIGNYNPTGVWLGGWGWNSSTATATLDGYTTANTTSPIGVQTFPSGSGRMQILRQDLNDAWNDGTRLGTWSASVNILTFGVSIVGGLKLSLSAAWASDTARTDSVSGGTYGRYCNVSGLLYLGTFRTTSTTQTEDSLSKRFLWNMYNQVQRTLYTAGYATTAYSYTTAAWRQVANQANQKVEWISGFTNFGGAVTVSGRHRGYGAAGAGVGVMGIGLDTITSPFAVTYLYGSGGAFDITADNTALFDASIGYHYVSLLEYGGTGVTYDSQSTGNGLRGSLAA